VGTVREWAEDDLRANGLTAVLRVGVVTDGRWVALYEADGGRLLLCDARRVGDVYGMGTVEFTGWTAISGPVGSAAGGVLPKRATQIVVRVPDAEVLVRVAQCYWIAAVTHTRTFTLTTLTAQPLDDEGKAVGPHWEGQLFRPPRGAGSSPNLAER
jgi:hypothetical protein